MEGGDWQLESMDMRERGNSVVITFIDGERAKGQRAKRSDEKIAERTPPSSPPQIIDVFSMRSAAATQVGNHSSNHHDPFYAHLKMRRQGSKGQ